MFSRFALLAVLSSCGAGRSMTTIVFVEGVFFSLRGDNAKFSQAPAKV